MAESNGPLWPGPVTFNDDDPKKGFFTLFLTFKDMKVKKSMGLIGKASPLNTVFNEAEMFTEKKILVTAKVTDKEGAETEYEYKKPLPEQINPDKCTYKFKSDQIILSVCKAESVSWAQHAKYLIKRD